MDQLKQIMQKALLKHKGSADAHAGEANELRFTLDPNNSNRATGNDNQTFVMLEYGNSPQENYINYSRGETVQYFHFDNHHNKACSVFITSDRELYPDTILNLRKALKTIGFTRNIEFNFI